MLLTCDILYSRGLKNKASYDDYCERGHKIFIIVILIAGFCNFKCRHTLIWKFRLMWYLAISKRIILYHTNLNLHLIKYETLKTKKTVA